MYFFSEYSSSSELAPPRKRRCNELVSVESSSSGPISFRCDVEGAPALRLDNVLAISELDFDDRLGVTIYAPLWPLSVLVMVPGSGFRGNISSPIW